VGPVPHATVNDDVYEGYYIPKGLGICRDCELPLNHYFTRGYRSSKHMVSCPPDERRQMMVISTYERSMAHNPGKYPNPRRFIPERHISGVASGELQRHSPNDISFVFGFGRRIWYAI
jgi:hypothetical protein